MSSAKQLVQHQLKRQETLQPSGGTVTTTHENIFQRMGNAFVGVIVGIFMMVFSVPILWLNEKRSAKYEALIDKGESECRETTADVFNEKNMHCLVHVTGTTSSTQPVKDHQFNVHYESGVIRLSSVVQIYQWKETEKSRTQEKKDNFGGKSTTTETWKEYSQEWLASYDSGEGFEKRQQHRNTKPQGIEPGSFSDTCKRVEFGKGFMLGNAEVESLTGGSNAKIAQLVCEKNTGLKFVAADGGFYYCGKSNMSSPEIGDVRVRFTVLNDGPATVVALQAEAKEKNRGSFMPYRVIRRSPCPCCPLSEDAVKERLYEEAKRSNQDINDAEMWGGIMGCLCCACNIVQFCCGAVGAPEIQDTFSGILTKAEAFNRIKGKASFLKWCFRVAGWLIMFVGLTLTFSPFTTFLEIIPFGIGSALSSFAGGIVFIFSFSVTLIVAGLIVALAYSMYHPVVGIAAFAFVAAIVAGILVLCNMVHSH